MLSAAPVRCPITLDERPLSPQITPCGHVFSFPAIVGHLVAHGGPELRRSAPCPLCYTQARAGGRLGFDFTCWCVGGGGRRGAWRSGGGILLSTLCCGNLLLCSLSHVSRAALILPCCQQLRDPPQQCTCSPPAALPADCCPRAAAGAGASGGGAGRGPARHLPAAAPHSGQHQS
jgi:hypothetical protein